jgi:lipopolysaccharide export system protein LptA
LTPVLSVSTSNLPQDERGGETVPIFQHVIIASLKQLILAIALVIAATLAANTAWTADQAQPGQSENEPIQIVADRLISFNEEKYAEFIGNVKVTQGEFTITSDKLRIYYQGELLENEKKGGDEELLKKIIATGNVKINSEQYNAEADTAEYDTEAKTVILSGENAKVISGKNSIAGSKITLNQKSGQVKVESSATKRIKAEFFTKEKAADSFKMEKAEE